MSDKLDVLRLACDELIVLKNNENLYKRASVIAASDALLNLHGKSGMHKTAAGPVLKTIGWAIPLVAGMLLAKNYKDIKYNTQLGLNYLNSDWGQEAAIARANGDDLTPAQRDRFLISRFGENRDYNQIRDYADSLLTAKRERARRKYLKHSAQSRANKYIRRGFADADSAYNNIMAGNPGYSYGPYSPDYYSTSIW